MLNAIQSTISIRPTGFFPDEIAVVILHGVVSTERNDADECRDLSGGSFTVQICTGMYDVRLHGTALI
jgi:hypothetical protein